MKNFWVYSRKNKLAIHLVMVMFLLYPSIFSFSHALSHHLFAKTNSDHLVCCSIHSLEDSGTSIQSNHDQTRCPIHDYEFPLAIENNAEPLNESYLKFSEYIVQHITIFIPQELCRKSSPRAPPAIV